MRHAIFVVVVAVFLCAQFAFAEAGIEAIRPLMNITQADADAVDPNRFAPLGELPDYEYRYWEGLDSIAQTQTFPVWGPDGDTVYLSGGNSIWRVPVSTGQPEMVTDFYMQHEGDYFRSGAGFMFDFMPDSNELLYSSTEIDEEYGTIVTIGRDVDGVINQAGFGNSRRIMYAVDVETGHKRVEARDEISRIYSASCRYYAYMTHDCNLNEQVGGIVDTVTDEDIEFPQSYATFAFTPNERYMIAVNNGKEPGVIQIDLETGKHTVLFDDSTSETPPIIMYGITSNSEWAIYSRRHSIDAYNLYTGETTVLLSLTKDEILVRGDLSPDDKTIAFMMDKILGRYEVDGEQYTETSGYKVYLLDIDLPMNSDLQTAVAEEIPASFALLGNYPNPFNPTTTIGFTLGEPGEVSLTLYSVTGQAIRELVSGQMTPGRHSVVWDGCDDAGNQVAAGVYVSRLVMGGQSVAGRMTLVK